MAATLLAAQTQAVAADHFGSDWEDTCDTTAANQCVGWDIKGVQEFGHSCGLRHSTTDGTSTCMIAVATQSTVIRISSHDTSHLNGYFQ